MSNLRASIDIGSNSILLLVVDPSDNHKVLANESNVTGLGRDLDKNGEFLQIAMDESFEVLKSYAKICKDLNVDFNNIIVTATEASRVSKNAADFFTKVKDECGFTFTIISGLGEAYYSTKGVLFDQNITEDEITIMDIGGASTELIKVNVPKREIISSFSMPIGVVRMTNWKENNEQTQNMEKVLTEYAEKLKEVKTNRLYCVAGTMTSVGNMYLGHKEFIEKEVHALNIKTQEIEEIRSKYDEFSSDNFLQEFPFLGKRAKTIHSGLVLANRVFKELAVQEVYISTYGLRYGTIISDKIKDEYVWKRI